MPIVKRALSVVSGGVLLLLGGCALEGPQSTFSTVGYVAKKQLDLFMLTYWLGLIVFIGVAAVLAYTLWRYRQKPDDDGSLPPQIHGNVPVEIGLTVLPVIFLVIIAVPTVRLILELDQRAEQRDATELEVIVTGYQWWWSFEYPELGITTANELHLPAGERVNLRLRSADVIHSFWAPRIAGKKDLIPNQDNEMWLIADEPGSYLGQCAELCLGAHAYMRFRVIVDDEESFAAWTEAFREAETQRVATDPLVSRGAQLFKSKGCAGCHAIAGVSTNRVGPDLTNFGLRTSVAAGVLENTPENLARWLRDPHEVKPGNYMPALWSEGDPSAEEEIAALVAYLESLGETEERLAGGTYGDR